MLNTHKKILVVDDNEINRKILCRILGDEYETVQAENGQEALEILQKRHQDIVMILLDIIMPVMDGYTFMEKMHEHPEYTKIPVIVTTQREGTEEEIKALSSGAIDFITKPYSAMIIKHRIANLIKLQENSMIISKIERDSLTGLLTKEFFYHSAWEEIISHKNCKYDIICADIEKFKLINDMFGAKVGDKLLAFVARILEEKFPNCLCGRLGADIFGVLVEHNEVYNDEIFEEMNAKINTFRYYNRIVVRYGIYSIENLNMTVRAMCDRAVLAINSIKEMFGQYYAYYDESLRDKLLKEQMITNGMKAAIEEKQFKVYFQPKYNLENGKLAGAEALVRWIHPKNGFMSPGDFIPIFEKNGFITQLDRYVWEETCRMIRQRMDEGVKVVPVSVNVSRLDIYNGELMEILISLLEKYQLETKYLHLEITETAYTENPEQIIESISKLKDYGFVIEMDDFGSGYSSLNMLSKLPIDILKLDMKFIQNELEVSARGNILSFIISLAKWMGLLVISEGVETKEQAERLREMECNYVQGYYFARPMPEEDFKALLNHSEIDIREEDTQVALKLATPYERLESNNATMLIVDDLKINRSMLSDIFRDKYKTVEAENGEIAIRYIQEHKEEIEVILLDLVMPVKDGFEVLNFLKKNEDYSGIPVIVTSQAGDNSEMKALQLGAKDFIAKPLKSEVCKCRVANVVEYTRLKKLLTEEH